MRPTRSPFLLAHSLRVNSCNSWAKKIFPNNSRAIIFRGISVAPKTTSSCPKLSLLSSYISPLIALVQISATDPVAIPVAHSLRANSCNSWAKKIFPNNSWAIIHSLLIAPAKDNFKLSQVVPVVVISPLIALVTISATDPVAIYPLQRFVSIRAIRGQYKFVVIIPPHIIIYPLFQPITHILSICEHSKT